MLPLSCLFFAIVVFCLPGSSLLMLVACMQYLIWESFHCMTYGLQPYQNLS